MPCAAGRACGCHKPRNERDSRKDTKVAEVNHVEDDQDGPWEMVSITMDSGAAETVGGALQGPVCAAQRTAAG